VESWPAKEPEGRSSSTAAPVESVFVVKNSIQGRKDVDTNGCEKDPLRQRDLWSIMMVVGSSKETLG
jgi:hypothetical protein